MPEKDKSTDAMVAKRLRVVRDSKSLSQRELARRAGVGSGTISLIESGATQPSVAVLKKILDGVPMDLATFFSFELTAHDTIHFPKSGHVDIGAAGLKYLLIAAEKPKRKIQMLHEFYEPGKASGRGTLSHEGEECAVVIRGQLEVTVDKEIVILGPGDAYYFNSAVPHRFRNVGDTVCEVVSACTPASF